MTTPPKRWTLTVLWIASLTVVAASATIFIRAQVPDARVISGSDLGFRVDSRRNGVPTGRFVVRINGAWVELKESIGSSNVTR